MSARGMVIAMVAGTALVVFAVPRAQSSHERPAPQPRAPEEPWLSKEAAAQIIDRDGKLGPLFDRVVLGGPVPAPDVREQIAAFARANRVRIDLETDDDELVAIRFEVSYGGCCGYEGADVLALRLGRPETGSSCLGGEDAWLDDWTATTDDGVFMRASVRVNRVIVRWQKPLSMVELIERTDRLVGMRTDDARKASGATWLEVEPGRRFIVELPYAYRSHDDYLYRPKLEDRDDLGVVVTVERGRVVGAKLELRELDSDAADDLRAIARARWGRPRIGGDAPTWRTNNRIVTADYSYRPTITIAAISDRH